MFSQEVNNMQFIERDSVSPSKLDSHDLPMRESNKSVQCEDPGPTQNVCGFSN